MKSSAYFAVLLALLMAALSSCATPPSGKPAGYVSVKATRAKLAATSSTCSACTEVGSFIITQVGCGAGDVALGLACTAAEIAFPEFDVVIIPLCTAMEVGLPAVCEAMGSTWVKKYPDQAAKQICTTCSLCP